MTSCLLIWNRDSPILTTYKHTHLLSMVHTKGEGGSYYNGLISNAQLWKWNFQSSTKFNHTWKEIDFYFSYICLRLSQIHFPYSICNIITKNMPLFHFLTCNFSNSLHATFQIPYMQLFNSLHANRHRSATSILSYYNTIPSKKK